jgi:hypothetical protein
VVFSILLIILFSVPTYGATWELNFENQLGKFYHDTESIHQTPENTILVWRKIIPANNAEIKIYEMLYEVDCSRRKYRILQGTINGGKEGIEEYIEADWINFPSVDIWDAFFKAICKEGLIK